MLNGTKRVRDSSVRERASIRVRPSALVRYPALLRGVEALIGPRVRSSPTVPLYHATTARFPVSLAVCPPVFRFEWGLGRTVHTPSVVWRCLCYNELEFDIVALVQVNRSLEKKGS